MTGRSYTAMAALLTVAACWAPQPGWPADPRPGGWRLADADSPYLRMHADNPVAWRHWGGEALGAAREQGKPLFISIGYFTCHWCHVMERESFTDPDVARLLNRHFVPVKIDREQQPAVDAAYMRFVRMTGERGGWPLNVFATPQGHPFAGTTYLPPEPRGGRASFSQVLTRVHEAWRTNRDGLEATAQRAAAQAREAITDATPVDHLPAGLPGVARAALAERYDEMHGGFGTAPRFPEPARLVLMLQGGDDAHAEMAIHTLRAMADGGIHDQLAGGFHRYATDPGWRVPHFEKTLYDQALIPRAYLAAYRQTGAARYAEVARRTLDFALSQMRHDGGAFYSALAADSPVPGRPSHVEEGAYYTWTWQQWTQALGDSRLRAQATRRYGVERHGNLPVPADHPLANTNVLYRTQASGPSAHDETSTSADDARPLPDESDRTDSIAQRLLEARGERPAVPIDDKIVTEWNGYMIATLADAARVLDEPRYAQAAKRAAAFVLEQLHEADTHDMHRTWARGEPGSAGVAADYAGVVQGLIALHALTRAESYLDAARGITQAQIARFWDASHGGFYATADDAHLWLRGKPVEDGVTPSANAVSIGNLLTLSAMTGDKRYAAKALRAARHVTARLEDNPTAMAGTLGWWPELLRSTEKRRNTTATGHAQE